MALSVGGGTALGSAIGGLMGLAGSALEYKYSKDLAAQQNQYNIDMWKMQNEYNSPQAQMQRFRDAGLNPNLIYGQGTSGNASSPPQQVTPQTPQIAKHMQQLAQAFNIEALKTNIAERKKAENEEKISWVNAQRELQHFDADIALGRNYHFNVNTGRFEFSPGESEKIVSGAGRYYMMQHLADNFRSMYLMPFRSALMEWQKNYLVPQVTMSNYEQKYQPYSFWIGNTSRALQGLTAIPSIFSPLKWVQKPGTIYNKYKQINYNR